MGKTARHWEDTVTSLPCSTDPGQSRFQHAWTCEGFSCSGWAILTFRRRFESNALPFSGCSWCIPPLLMTLRAGVLAPLVTQLSFGGRVSTAAFEVPMHRLLLSAVPGRDHTSAPHITFCKVVKMRQILSYQNMMGHPQGISFLMEVEPAYISGTINRWLESTCLSYAVEFEGEACDNDLERRRRDRAKSRRICETVPGKGQCEPHPHALYQ